MGGNRQASEFYRLLIEGVIVIIRIVLALRRKIYSIYMTRKCTNVGRNIVFEPKSVLLNPKHITMGNGCYIGPGCRLEAWDYYRGESYSPSLVLGNNVKINSKCHIGAINSIIIEDDCLLGSNVFITDHSHGNISREEMGVHPSDRPLYSKGGVRIGEKTWIGENVVILPGVSIGKHCVIGASAVVTKDVPDGCLVVGNPGRIAKNI